VSVCKRTTERLLTNSRKTFDKVCQRSDRLLTNNFVKTTERRLTNNRKTDFVKSLSVVCQKSFDFWQTTERRLTNNRKTFDKQQKDFWQTAERLLTNNRKTFDKVCLFCRARLMCVMKKTEYSLFYRALLRKRPIVLGSSDWRWETHLQNTVSVIGLFCKRDLWFSARLIGAERPKKGSLDST